MGELAKICGVRDLHVAQAAVEHGADLVGVILAPNRPRTVDLAEAQRISAYLHETNPPRALLVGVFRNQPLDEILRLQETLDLDVVQLHGSEPLDWLDRIPCTVIRRLAPGSPTFVEDVVYTSKLDNTLALVDSEQGGDGRVVDWSALADVDRAGGSYLLAGGLTPENVALALAQPGCMGVDVSGGVESNGVKDLAKVSEFLRVTRSRSA